MGLTRLSISVYLESPLDFVVRVVLALEVLFATHQIDIPGPQERPFSPGDLFQSTKRQRFETSIALFLNVKYQIGYGDGYRKVSLR
jgi:hypothetical protein